MKIRGPLHWRQIANACLALAVGLLLVAALHSVVSAGEPPRRKIIFLFDNSRTMYVGTDKGSGDPNGQAHKMARLMVRYLQSMVTDGRYEIGAANFSSSTEDYASDYRVLMPLKPAESWSEYDIAQLQPFSCPDNDDPIKGVAGKDPCVGTYRSSAIGWAQGQLTSCPANKDELSCLIVMFTDDQTVESDSETQEDIRRTLQGLPAEIDFHIVVFPQDGVPDTIWHEWSNEDRSAGEKSLVEIPVINTDIGPTTDTYRQLIEMLSISGTSAEDFILDLPSPQLSLSTWYAPNVNLVEMDLISSASVLSETYAIAPDIRAGSKRLWYLPEATEVNAGFETNPTTGVDDVAVLRILTHTTPIEADVAIWPTHPKLNEPIEVRAMIHAGARIITDTEKLAVVAHIDGTESEIEMQPNPSSGFWIATIPAAMRSGEMDVSIDLVPKGWSMGEASTASMVTAYIKNAEWKVELFVEPITGTDGQVRQLEVVVRLGDEIVDVSSQAVVSAVLRETGQTVSLNSRNGTWRASIPVTSSQDVIVTARIDTLGEITTSRYVSVITPPMATVTQATSKKVLLVPDPKEGVTITVMVDSSEPFTPTVYLYDGEVERSVALAKVGDNTFAGAVERPVDLSGARLSSANVRLQGDTTVKGGLVDVALAVLVVMLVGILVVLIAVALRKYKAQVKMLDEIVQGDRVLLDQLNGQLTERSGERTELARQLARFIAHRSASQ